MADDTSSYHLENLTESIILLILTFLPFKEAIRTSVLARHWSNRWRSSGVLELNESFFVDPELPLGRKRSQQQAVFLAFARRWFSDFRGASIRKFIIIFSEPLDVLITEVQEWINFAVSRNPEELTLDFSDHTWTWYMGMGEIYRKPKATVELPALVYERSAILTSLKLVFCKLDLSKFMNLSMLTELSLGWIELKDEIILNLLKTCPLLESLSLENCWSFSRVVVENARRLKKLVIHRCLMDGYPWIQLQGVQGLQYFKYSSNIGYFQLENPMFLVEAHLDFTMEYRFERVFAEYICFLLDQLEHVKVLSVCSYLVQILPHHPTTSPFDFRKTLNVRHLILKVSLEIEELLGIKMLIKNCKLLEKITIELGSAEIYIVFQKAYPHWDLNDGMNECFENLKIVEIKGFRGSENEEKMLEFILNKGVVLEEVNIYLLKNVYDDEKGSYRKHYEERANEVGKCRKASPFVQINIF